MKKEEKEREFMIALEKLVRKHIEYVSVPFMVGSLSAVQHGVLMMATDFTALGKTLKGRVGTRWDGTESEDI